MRRKSKITILWIAEIAVVTAITVICLSRTGVGESVKRESARLFDYEYIPNQNVDIDRCEAAGLADSIYKDFRKKYRFHYQGMGMASFGDSSRMILLSDIPPHFETDSIAPIFAEFTHKTELRKHAIGYDGYTTDVIILLGNATQENCDRLLKRLNKELFFSEYKPTVTTLPAEEKRRYFAKESIDYQITLNEFNTWFMEEGEGFIHLDDTSKVMTVSDLFAAKARGVYFSQQPGFVAWAVAKNADIAAQVGEIRQFTLDADLILGALADSSTLVIIGRERQSPLYELPPLQIESILLLASTTEKVDNREGAVAKPGHQRPDGWQDEQRARLVSNLPEQGIGEHRVWRPDDHHRRAAEGLVGTRHHTGGLLPLSRARLLPLRQAVVQEVGAERAGVQLEHRRSDVRHRPRGLHHLHIRAHGVAAGELLQLAGAQPVDRLPLREPGLPLFCHTRQHRLGSCGAVHGVVPAVYRQQYQLLGRYLRLVPEEQAFLAVQAHGGVA